MAMSMDEKYLELMRIVNDFSMFVDGMTEEELKDLEKHFKNIENRYRQQMKEKGTMLK